MLAFTLRRALQALRDDERYGILARRNGFREIPMPGAPISG